MITIKKNKTSRALKDAVEKMSGVDLSVCFQCKKCSSGCPVAKLAKTRPSEIMRRLHLGAGDELLESDLLWMCVSCETCSARCPMGIDVAAVMDALRKLALERGASKQEGNVPLFNQAFLKTVEIFGRTYEIGDDHRLQTRHGQIDERYGKIPDDAQERQNRAAAARGAATGKP